MNAMPLNRVLLRSIGAMRETCRDGVEMTVRDGSALDFQVGELIAFGAAEIAVRSDWLSEGFMSAVQPALRKRIVLVDPKGRAVRAFLGLFAPIAEELQVHKVGLPYAIAFKGTQPEEPVSRAVCDLAFNLPDWILGVQERLEVDVDVRSLRQSAEQLRSTLGSPQARANLATLSGILSTYTQTTIDALSLTSAASRRHVSLFRDFLDDETYRLLSEESHNLGYPSRARRALSLIVRYVRDLLDKPFVREAADWCTKEISTATKLPLPDSEILRPLLSGGYVPPIVSLGPTLQKAEDDWARSRPGPVYPKDYPELPRNPVDDND